MNARTLNMLLAARSLLETSGTLLTSGSDALTVARNVLVAQDTIELVLAALCVEIGGKFKLTEQISFYDLVGYIVEKYSDHDDADSQNAMRGALRNLNYARVRFKHYGDILDASTTYPLVEQALEVIDLLCIRAIGWSLRSLDAVAAVEHPAIAENLRKADKWIESGDYKESLINIARAISWAFWDYDIQGITVGKAESEGALLLSGRGVDPAGFLAMQRFLPCFSTPYDENAEFNIREYGHEANWTYENARFCWETALTIVLRLQHARSVPQARDFYDEFEDVITISVDSTTAQRFMGYMSGENQMPSALVECNFGQVFSGRASGFYEIKADAILEFSMPLSEANWIRLENHNLQEGPSFIFGTDELWFSGKDVTVTYRESELARLRKKHLAEQNSPVDEGSPDVPKL